MMPKLDIIKGFSAHPLSGGTIFQTSEWQQNWLAHYGDPSRVISIQIKEGNDLVGLWNLYRHRSGWRSIRPLGVGPSDYLGPIGEYNELYREAIQDLNKKSLLDIHQLPSDHPALGSLEGHEAIEQAKCLVLDLPSSFDEYVKSLSKSLRYDVRRINGKALQEKGARVEWVSPETVERFADAFFELHKLRWKQRGLPGAFFGKAERFQRDWLRLAAQQNRLWMNLLIADGKAVGCVYAMRHEQTCYFYQAGMDPSAASLSPGTVLVAQTIQRAIEEGCTEFDFMRGDEPYKRRWKPTRERTNFRIILPPQTALTKAGYAWNKAAWRVESKVRERVEGKSLRNPKPQN